MISIINKHTVCVALLILLVTDAINAYDCPEYCTCFTVHRQNSTYNHAKCTSLSGLREFGRTATIQSLDCSNIGIEKLTNQLDKLTNLTQLDLSNNKLAELTDLRRRIDTLNLSHNRITSGKLSKIPHSVQHLNLSYNDITYIPLDFKKLINLKSLELNGNPINCTCDTLKVRNWLNTQNVFMTHVVKCSSPIDIKGKPWLQIPESDICQRNDNLRNDIFDTYDERMQGDDPNASGDDNDTPELENEFIPQNDKNAVTTNIIDETADTNGSEEHDDVINTPTLDLSKVDFPHTTDDPTELETHATNIDDAIQTPIIDMTTIDFPHTTNDPTELTNIVTEKTNDVKHEVFDDVEGSGDVLPQDELPTHTTVVDDTKATTTEEPDDENSGGGPLLFSKSNEYTDLSSIDHEDEDDDNTQIIDGLSPLGIFGNTNDSIDDNNNTSIIEQPVVEDVVKTIKIDETEAVPTNEEIDKNKDEIKILPNIVSEQSKNESNDTEQGQTTMILLVILGVVLVALLAFVIIKKKRSNNRNRRRKQDAEAPTGTEMLDMDKSLLGKPVETNGNGKVEFIPLKGNKSSANGQKPTDDQLRKAQEPLLKKIQDSEMDSEERPKDGQQSLADEKPCEELPVTESNNNVVNSSLPIQSTAQSPAQSNRSPIPPYRRKPDDGIPAVHPQQPLHNGHPPMEGDDEVFVPVSPRQGRYSPVYSPETGRVKIKLAEMPKPKTPMLVTRSRSNAGDIILTPDLNHFRKQ